MDKLTGLKSVQCDSLVSTESRCPRWRLELWFRCGRSPWSRTRTIRVGGIEVLSLESFISCYLEIIKVVVSGFVPGFVPGSIAASATRVLVVHVSVVDVVLPGGSSLRTTDRIASSFAECIASLTFPDIIIMIVVVHRDIIIHIIALCTASEDSRVQNTKEGISFAGRRDSPGQ